MDTGSTANDFNPGDSVLARLNDARIPGVVEATDGDRLHIRLSQPWVDDSGTETSTVLLPVSEVEPVLDGNARPELTG